MHIETPSATLNQPQEAVFQYLSELRNFEELMPETLEKFEVISEDQFRFVLRGMPEIMLRRAEEQSPRKLVLSAANGKLPFTLTVEVQEAGPAQSQVIWNFEGSFNAMMAMMVKSPITNFLKTLSDNLSKKFGA